MKTLVFIKQVPDTADIKQNKDNTLNREGVEAVMNPCDEFALEAGLSLNNSELYTVTMGPSSAEDMLRKTLALGAKEAYLLSDKKFAGSDTLATTYVLSKFVTEFHPDVKLILCGYLASDGDTAQTGPGIAARLNFSLVSRVEYINELTNEGIFVTRKTEFGKEKIFAKFPAVICIEKIQNELRIPFISGYVNSKNKTVNILNAEDLKIEADKTGLKGSPTCVVKTFTPKVSREGKIFEDKKEFINVLVNDIKQAQND